MKKLILPMLLLFSICAFSQKIEVKKTTQISAEKNGKLAWVQFVPQTDYLLVSTPNFEGLYLLDTKSKAKIQVCADAGAGYNPLISNDGKRIVYKSDSFKNNLKYSKLIEYNRDKKSTNVLVDETRALSVPNFIGSELVYFEQSNLKKLPFEQNTAKACNLCVKTENLKPYLIQSGSADVYQPSGDGNYIWVSLSPDEKKMVYNFNGLATFVSDLEGNIIAELGHFHAPKWLNNEVLIGMNDKDNGSTIVSSDIVAYSLKSKKIKNLTNSENQIEMYPAVSPDESQIAYETEKGEVFVMKVEVK